LGGGSKKPNRIPTKCIAICGKKKTPDGKINEVLEESKRRRSELWTLLADRKKKEKGLHKRSAYTPKGAPAYDLWKPEEILKLSWTLG